MPNSQAQIVLAERHFRAGQTGPAEQILREVVAVDPKASRAFELLAYIFGNRGESAECERLLRQAAAAPNCSAEALFYLGRVQLQLARPREAIASFEASMRRAGDFFEALHELGVAHAALGEHARALAFYERAGRKNPRSLQLLTNTAASLVALRRPADALQCYDRALQLAPDDIDALASRAATLVELGRRPDALASYERALALLPAGEPDMRYLHGDVLQMRMRLCRWDDWAERALDLRSRAERGERAAEPFALLPTPAGPAAELACARSYSAAEYPPRAADPFAPREPGRRLRIGYFSNDFRNHATSHLMVRLLELHDRTHFEWIAFSFSAKRDDMTERVAAAVDRFVAVDGLGDDEVAALAREAGLDIAVDLHGWTEGRRTGIFARRVAPLQVAWLGYPGTMGCDFIDYVVADRIVIPPEDRRHYSEKVLQLPGCYQPNDDTKAIAPAAASRADEGLPDEGFVFACFNAAYKITPDAFDVWMRLLRQVPGSVLWLFAADEDARSALLAEAAARGVEPQRLAWAGPLPLAGHLARLAHADLFLDTFHYNAHTTCSDALWAGLPVLTLAGPSFASRVAASLLEHVGLPELVTRSAADYEALALELARSPERLGTLRQRLQQQREGSALFDSARFARGLEAGFEAMWRRHAQGLPPDHIELADPAAVSQHSAGQ